MGKIEYKIEILEEKIAIYENRLAIMNVDLKKLKSLQDPAIVEEPKKEEE